MRLVYAQRDASRAISFEFLNRQLVWHAFTDFLLFLLPLLRPRRLLRKLLRLPTHPLLLGTLLHLLPSRVASAAGLSRSPSGAPQFKAPAFLRRSTGNDAPSAPCADLPEGVCAICFTRLLSASSSSALSGMRAGIPSSDPLDPSAHTLAPSRVDPSSSLPTPAPPRRGDDAARREWGTGAQGIKYADALVHTPYAPDCCGAAYCYVCLAGRLLDESAREELEEDKAPWTCLRCGEGVRSAQRVSDVLLLEEDEEKRLAQKTAPEEEDEEELDLLGE
jgi:peroxin-2